MNKLKEMNNMTDTMMNRVDEIIEMVKAKGINATLSIKNDNGIERIGFALGDGSVRPTLYPKMETNNIKSIVDYLINGYEQCKVSDDFFKDVTDHFTDFNYVKGGIIPVLVKECADDIVSRNFLDLKIMYRYMIPNPSASIAIKESHLDTWNKTEDDIYNLALENARDTFTDMSINEALGIPFPDDIGMRVISNTSKTYGASALLFPEVFEKYGNNARILPSSIHEVIVVSNATDKMDDDGLADMIISVNENELKPEEILSNHPYKYEDGLILCG